MDNFLLNHFLAFVCVNEYVGAYAKESFCVKAIYVPEHAHAYTGSYSWSG
jgi:hypothetical protein